MAFTRNVLHFGYIADTKTDIYTPTAGSKGLVHNITLHNTNTSSTPEMVDIFYSDGTNDLQQWHINLDATETVMLQFGNEGYMITDGGKLSSTTTTATKVTIKIDGAEEN